MWKLATPYPKRQPQGAVALPSCAPALCCCPGRGASWPYLGWGTVALGSLQTSEGTPFQAESESLHVSLNNCIDPSKQLLRGFCFMQSAPSHT